MDDDAPTAEPLPLDRVTPPTFEEVLDTAFTPPFEGPPFTLMQVGRLPDVPGQPRAEPFALTFARPGDIIAQGTLTLTHDTLGTLEIFLVPSGRDGDVVRYEAVFN